MAEWASYINLYFLVLESTIHMIVFAYSNQLPAINLITSLT